MRFQMQRNRAFAKGNSEKAVTISAIIAVNYFPMRRLFSIFDAIIAEINEIHLPKCQLAQLRVES
jgi:hypothetical protein